MAGRAVVALGPVSVVVVFALVANGEDGDGAFVFDFEQDHITGPAEWDDPFAQERVGVIRLGAGKGHVGKNVVAPLDGRARKAAA